MVHLRARTFRLLAATACALSLPASLDGQGPPGSGAVARYAGVAAPVPAASLPARQGTITGRVTDRATAQPLAGVNVQVVGTTRAARTGADGRFTIAAVPDGTHRVRATLVGYAPSEQEAVVSPSGTAVVDFGLAAQAVMLEEVVTVGYGTQRKVNLTGSVEMAAADEIEARPAPTVSSALQGLLPGVTVRTPTGQPGETRNTIRIRGVGTLGNSNPLVLIDGIEGTMDIINPNDVASISVLKDAAAASIYGARGANGVILITTRAGTRNSPIRIRYSGSTGMQMPTRFPEFLGSPEYMQMANESQRNVGRPTTFTEEQIRKATDGSDPNYHANTNWAEALFRRSAPQQSHNVSLTGGSDQTSYYLSYGLLQQQGIIVGDNFANTRHNLRMRLDLQPTERLSLDGSIGYIDRTIFEPASETAAGSGVVYISTTISPLVPVRFTTGGWGYGGGSSNPVALATDGGRNTFNSQETTLNFEGAFRLLEGLQLTGKYGMVMSNSRRDIFTSRVNYYRPEDGEFWYTSTPLNSLDSRDYIQRYQSLTGGMDYNRLFGSHALQLLLGASQEWNRNDFFRATRQGFVSEQIRVLQGGTLNERNYGDAGHWALRSLFGRANYNFDGRYLFEANMRYDGSSRFAQDRRHGLFPSVSAGWRLSEEPFMGFLEPLFSDVKLRASWGKLGNQYVGSSLYPYIAAIQGVGTAPLGGQLTSAFAQTAAPNPRLTWESITMTNVGVDASLLDGRLDLTGDWFIKTTDDILLRVPLPTVLGISEPEQNAGAVENRGWELGLDWRDRVGDVAYGVNVNYADVINRVTSLGGVPPTYGTQVRMVGHPIDAFYGLVALRIAQPEDFTANSAGKLVPNFPVLTGDAAAVGPGDLIYKDLNGDGAITLADDRTVIGSPIPRHTFGVRTDFEWRGLDASFFVQGVGKADGYIFGSARHALITESAYPQKVHRDRWTPENRDAAYPRLTYQQDHNVRLSTFWLEDASYARLKNVQLGYTVQPRSRGWLPVDRVRLYASAENLFTKTDYFYAYDPESPVSQGGFYPQVKTLVFGLDAAF